METFLIKAAQLLLSLSLLVIVHEFGHFLFARLFKIRVEKFYLFFDPWFSLFKFKPKNSDTEYGIGWLPLGGYVKIAGMIDESMDKEQMAQEPQPWEFRTKPAWQRLLVMVGGVLFNFILALFIISMMMFAQGDTYVPLDKVQDGMVYSDVAKQAGFQDKDILVRADGKELKIRDGILGLNTQVAFMDGEEIEVMRAGKLMTINLPGDFADNIIASRKLPYDFWVSPVVNEVSEGGEAQRIGMQKGDSITSVNGVAISSFNRLQEEVLTIGKNLSGTETYDMPIVFVREGVEQTVTAKMDTLGLIGISVMPKQPTVVTDKYSFFASFPAGISMGVNLLKAYAAQSKFLFSKEGAKNVGGFAAIGNMFPAEWDWVRFWSMTAFLSIALAFLNILPIPVLDGGHIVFLLYEMITGRQPNEKFQEYAQMVGMFLLLGLLLYANGNDIVRFIFK